MWWGLCNKSPMLFSHLTVTNLFYEVLVSIPFYTSQSQDYEELALSVRLGLSVYHIQHKAHGLAAMWKSKSMLFLPVVSDAVQEMSEGPTPLERQLQEYLVLI